MDAGGDFLIMDFEEYLKAKKLGDRAMHRAAAAGQYPYLPALDEILGKEGSTLSQVSLGLRDIPISSIAGTKTAGRQIAFASDFMPILDADTEFAGKWMRVYQYQMTEGISDPIIVYEYMMKFYVREGNKRVSVMKYLKMPEIEAEVTRIIPARTNEKDVRIYYEFMDFFKVCPIYELSFTREGAYSEFIDRVGESHTVPWSSDTVHMVEGACYRWETLYESVVGDKVRNLTAGDALLVYLNFYSLKSLLDQPRNVLAKRLERMLKEFRLTAEDHPLSLQESPSEKQPASGNFLQNLLRRPTVFTEEKPLHAAFIYDQDPDSSGLVNDHEIGRFYVSNALEGRLITRAYFNADSDEEVRKAIDQAVQDGAEVIFTVSPVQMPETLKAAFHYQNIHFLNCSVNLPHKSVRTYYGRVYEAKFLMGALAASCADSHRIGYVADSPIYGELASINAFAIGAAMIDPKIQISLKWSSSKAHDWRRDFQDEGISVLSGPDLAKPEEDNTEYGVYRMEPDGSVLNLAAPSYNWGKYYELILKTVISGTYDEDLSVSSPAALNYWYGMSAGVIDVVLSDQLSYYTRKMVQLFRKSVMEGSLNPFAGELRSQEGLIQDARAGKLPNEKIIEMNWLNDNIRGSIPDPDELNERAKRVMEISGIRKERS